MGMDVDPSQAPKQGSRSRTGTVLHSIACSAWNQSADARGDIGSVNVRGQSCGHGMDVNKPETPEQGRSCTSACFESLPILNGRMSGAETVL